MLLGLSETTTLLSFSKNRFLIFFHFHFETLWFLNKFFLDFLCSPVCISLHVFGGGVCPEVDGQQRAGRHAPRQPCCPGEDPVSPKV